MKPAYFDIEVSRVVRYSFYASLMEERRTTQRQRVFKAGTIAFDGSVVDCTIRNVSPSGAALDVVSPLGIPHEVTLNMLSRNAHQLCYVVWRKEKRIGVAFA